VIFYFPVFATAFDAFVGVLVQVGKVLPQFLVGGIDDVSVLDRGELGCQLPDGGNVKFVLMGLLRSLVSACLVRVGFHLIQNNEIGEVAMQGRMNA
jgi:hypothetical protein